MLSAARDAADLYVGMVLPPSQHLSLSLNTHARVHIHPHAATTNTNTTTTTTTTTPTAATLALLLLLLSVWHANNTAIDAHVRTPRHPAARMPCRRHAMRSDFNVTVLSDCTANINGATSFVRY